MSWTLVAEWLFDSPISGIWPILVVPALSAWLSDRAARRLPATRADWRIAAALAALPGLVMLVLLAVAAGRALLHLHWDGTAHLIQYHFIWVAAPAFLAWAGVKAVRRHRQLRALTGLAVAPEARLAAAGAEIGLRVSELPVGTHECFVAGLRQPVAYLSTGAIAALSCEELLATLHHERAHAAGRDPAMLTLLAFLADLAPGTDRALTAYRQARERQADLAAVRAVGALPLASALLAFGRPPAHAFGMAGVDPAWRLKAILGLDAAASGRTPRGVASALAGSAALLTWPLLQTGLAILLCST